MDARERASLDRYITGNYGEDQFPNEEDYGYDDSLDGACLCHDSAVCPDEITTELEEEYPWGRF